MICGAADEGSAALFVCGEEGLDLPEADRREIVVCGRGECVGGREDRLDSPRGRIGGEFVDWCEVWR